MASSHPSPVVCHPVQLRAHLLGPYLCRSSMTRRPAQEAKNLYNMIFPQFYQSYQGVVIAGSRAYGPEYVEKRKVQLVYPSHHTTLSCLHPTLFLESGMCGVWQQRVGALVAHWLSSSRRPSHKRGTRISCTFAPVPWGRTYFIMER